MTQLHPIQIAKRLVEADGYLELGLPAQALARLATLPVGGQFEAAAQFLRGRALLAQQRYADAVIPLATAAQLLPGPLDRSVWLQLSECYRRVGSSVDAVNSLGLARGAKKD